MEIISTIFKIRGELLNLNYLPYIRNQNCSLCEFDEIENVFHFLGRCEILVHIRKTFFDQYYLTEEEMIDYLNGKNWLILYNFCKEAY